MFPPAICVADSIVRWEQTSVSEDIYNHFTPKEWYKMVTDVHSDKEWREFLAEYNWCVYSCTLYDQKNNTPIAFIYLFNESEQRKVISIHGGGWNKSMHLAIFYYRGLILMIEHLLKQGIKVRTSCLIDNTRAYRFLHSVGFVKYRRSDTHDHMWINEKRLRSSTMYRRFRR